MRIGYTITLFVVFGFTLGFWTRGLHLSSFGNAVNGLAWILVAIYRGPDITDMEKS
jgi:hypothetical protein